MAGCLGLLSAETIPKVASNQIHSRKSTEGSRAIGNHLPAHGNGWMNQIPIVAPELRLFGCLITD